MSSQYTRFHEQTDDEWRRVMTANLGGTIFVFRQAITHMLGHGQGGSLVAVASMAARIGMRNYAPYAASKASIIAVIQNIAVEYARKGIRANALRPGWIETEMTALATPQLRDQLTRRTPVGRFGTPDDIGALAAFLGDPEQTFHTGQTVLVDGGYLTA
jgi:NAD(P)-dependent dehydrogenase (short-subunit alcohol dehydrogenase family)